MVSKFTYLFSLIKFLWRIFPLLRLIDFMLFLILAWRTWLLCVWDIFCLLLPGVLALVPSAMNPVQQLTFLIIYFRWREGVPTSVLGSKPNHLVSLFFLPMSGDPREVTEYKHLFLTVILWWLATVNSNRRIVVIIFLSSQWTPRDNRYKFTESPWSALWCNWNK